MKDNVFSYISRYCLKLRIPIVIFVSDSMHNLKIVLLYSENVYNFSLYFQKIRVIIDFPKRDCSSEKCLSGAFDPVKIFKKNVMIFDHSFSVAR